MSRRTKIDLSTDKYEYNRGANHDTNQRRDFEKWAPVVAHIRSVRVRRGGDAHVRLGMTGAPI